MRKLIVLVLVLAILGIVKCQGVKFCSSFCSSSCSGDQSDDCNSKCNANWVASGQTCIPNAGSGWVLHDTTPDVSGGTLGISYSSGITPTIDSSCNSMSYYGCEQLSVTLTSPFGLASRFTVLVSYIPPNSAYDLYNYHLVNIEDALSSCVSDLDFIVVLGDFNLPKVLWASSDDLGLFPSL